MPERAATQSPPVGPNVRTLGEFGAEETAAALDDLVTIVERHLPQRYYPSEANWRLVAGTIVVRTADIASTLADLIRSGAGGECLVALRTLYEHVVLFCWLTADPERNTKAWTDEAHRHRRAVYHEAKRFGIDGGVSKEELELIEEMGRPASVQQRAREADAYWSNRTSAFRAVTEERTTNQVLTLTGLYTGLYRIASRPAHGLSQALDTVAKPDDGYPGRWIVRREKRWMPEIAALAVPVFGLQLIACNDRLNWPNDYDVGEINNVFHAANRKGADEL